MFVENVVKTFEFLEGLEKKGPCFSQEEKQSFYRIAFYESSFDKVQKIILQVTAPGTGNTERKQMLDQYMVSLPKLPDDAAVQIENNIFQLQHMTYEREKVNAMLGEILEKNGVSHSLDFVAAQPGKRSFQEKERRAEGRNEKSK